MGGKPIYFKLEYPKPDPKFPTPLEVRICAKYDGTFHHMTEKITESLFDDYIDLLIKELEQIRKEGKRVFMEWPWRLKST
ncbi:MAG: hypothetical protein ACYDIC_03700 [Desulfobaccales bacterium]